MELKSNLILGLIMVIAIPITSVYIAMSGDNYEAPAGPEPALRIALDYVLNIHEEIEGLKIPESWEKEDITPEDLDGATTLRFTEGEWTATVIFAPISPSVYEIEIDCSEKGGFRWNGQVYSDGSVVETAFTLTG